MNYQSTIHAALARVLALGFAVSTAAATPQDP